MASLPGPTPSRKDSVRAVKRSMREMPTSGSDLYDRDCSPGGLGELMVGQQGEFMGSEPAANRSGSLPYCTSTVRPVRSERKTKQLLLMELNH